jgi:NAD(P)-dependent dehydrogenase (short-subunit alcohol dehydrogenase family)
MALNPPVTDWRGKTVWLIGASSGIGQATASLLHARGARVVVSARSAAALEAFAARHPGAVARPLDITRPQDVQAAAHAVLALGPLDHLVYCAGYYRELRATEFDLAEMLKHEQINYVGALYALDAVLPHFLTRSQDGDRPAGHISLISSVAGFRGLPKSLAYGPTKAALINLAEALYIDLRASHVGVSLINPGYVETPLTAGNRYAMPGLISAEAAAQEILKGWQRGEFEIHFPKRFTRWMKLLRLLPYRVYYPLIRRFTGL